MRIEVVVVLNLILVYRVNKKTGINGILDDFGNIFLPSVMANSIVENFAFNCSFLKQLFLYLQIFFISLKNRENFSFEAIRKIRKMVKFSIILLVMTFEEIKLPKLAKMPITNHIWIEGSCRRPIG